MEKENTIYGKLISSTSLESKRKIIINDNMSLNSREFLDLIDKIASNIPDDFKRIGIVMNHSAFMIAAIFAVLKKGCAYIPVEPFFPEDRINFMMGDAKADAVIANPEYKDKIKDIPLIEISEKIQRGNFSTDFKAKPDDPAYILYTSGSTGKPKGVCILNRNVCHYVRAFQNEFHPDENDIMLQYSVCSFDIFVEEVFTSLLSGASLAIPPEKAKSNINMLMDFVQANNVTMISGFPYLLLDINKLEKLPKSLRLLISGGDVLRDAYITNLKDKIMIYNTYGPSETTVCASYYRCDNGYVLDDGTFPVGKAVLGTRIEILDESLKSVPQGKIGEICIFGGGVSAGYIGNRKVENKAFITLPNGERFYRSGDLGYILPDGNIAFLRRKDMQIMISGKRVEPIEVENVFSNIPGIEKAVVKPFFDEQNLPYMIAYIVPKSENCKVSEIKSEMKKFLPEYMIPEYFIKMNNIPLNSNGKVDTNALPVILKEGNTY